VQAELAPGETVLGVFEPDLDQRLFFSRGMVVLTDRRLLALDPGNGTTPHWHAWPLDPGVELRSEERGPLGTLEWATAAQRLAHWRYTAGQSLAAHRLVQRLATWRASQAGQAAPPTTSVCPSCGAAVGPDVGHCPACAAGQTAPATSALLRLGRFARPHAPIIVLGFFLTLAGTAASLIPPYLTMPLLDKVLIPHQSHLPADFGLVPWYLGGLLGAALLAWLLDGARLFVLAWISERISADLRAATYGHMLRLSVEFFGGKRTGDLMARVGSDTERLCNYLSLNLVDFATDLLMITMTAAILLSIDPVLALAALCPFPVVVWLVQRVRGRLLRGYRGQGVAWSAMISVLADTVPGIRVVKAFAQETRESERFDAANQRVVNINNRVNRLWAYFGPTVTFLTTSGLLVVWAAACWRVKEGLVTVGVLTAFLAYIARFYARAESMIRMVSATQRAAASAQRIFEVLDRAPSVPEPARPVHPGRLAGAIELRGVRFKYGAREVLHGIDLSVRPGEMVGLVGPSGAGKSTLINLVCRFYDVAEGAILVDSVDVRSFPVEEYRRNIGIVLQDPFLFYGSVADNIAYGRPGATHAQVVTAARAARAHEFILRLPDGYDSIVGERGQSLSGGERQRTSIARALLIDPRILILDEATSSVDTQTEREIQKALQELVRGRTTLAIAHRLSTLRRADRLVVLEHGRIVEVGSHDELFQAGGAYARLHHFQGFDTTPSAGNGTKGTSEPEWTNPQAPMPLAVAQLASLSPCPRTGRLLFNDADGRQHTGVEPVRAFPISAPRAGIALCDPAGHELVWIPGLDDLPSPQRALLEDELARREFIPVLRRIKSISAPAEPSEWQVETDRGPTRFILNSEDDVHSLDSRRALIKDAQGLRYLIPDLRKLDATSRRLLERYL
jgi:ATP-binding cassette subfamily B protein